MEYELKDSGKREKYDTGAVRDVREGKGRFDLISPIGLRRLAGVYERGAKKYADRNWEKGIPISRCLDSALRHANQYLEGHRDEDHLAQAAWNFFAAMHFEETRPDLNDIPRIPKHIDLKDIQLPPEDIFPQPHFPEAGQRCDRRSDGSIVMREFNAHGSIIKKESR